MKRTYRLTKNRDFQRILDESVSVSGSSFIVYGSKSTLTRMRIGITVSKKLGGAVQRNLIKRQVRMMLQGIATFDRSVDLVVMIRRDYVKKVYSVNLQQLTTLYQRMMERL